MRYVLLIYGDDAVYDAMDQQEQAENLDGHYAFSDRYKDNIIGGEALLGVATATTVRVRDGKTLCTDGPFAETKEQLGGYYVIECADLAEAVAIAADIPDAELGSVEVRRVMELVRPL